MPHTPSVNRVIDTYNRPSPSVEELTAAPDMGGDAENAITVACGAAYTGPPWLGSAPEPAA